MVSLLVNQTRVRDSKHAKQARRSQGSLLTSQKLVCHHTISGVGMILELGGQG